MIPQPAVHITTQVCGTLQHMQLWYQIALWYFVWYTTGNTTGLHDTTASRSHYHTSLWYITTCAAVVFDSPVVFCVVTMCTTGLHGYHSQPYRLPHKSVVHYHTFSCGMRYSCGFVCGNSRYHRKYHRTFLLTSNGSDPGPGGRFPT